MVKWQSLGHPGVLHSIVCKSPSHPPSCLYPTSYLYFCQFLYVLCWLTLVWFDETVVNNGQASLLTSRGWWEWCVIRAQRILNPIIKETIMHAAFLLLLKMTAIIIRTTGHWRLSLHALCTFFGMILEMLSPKSLKDLKLFWLHFIESEIDKNVNHNNWVTKKKLGVVCDNTWIVIPIINQWLNINATCSDNIWSISVCTLGCFPMTQTFHSHPSNTLLRWPLFREKSCKVLRTLNWNVYRGGGREGRGRKNWGKN